MMIFANPLNKLQTNIDTMKTLTYITLAFLLFFNPVNATAQTVTVYKSPTCGCCNGWIDYLRDEGFSVEAIDLQNLDSIKQQHGVTPELQSCHTALVDGYVVEGHVPVNDIRRLLKEKPDIKGLTAPGMPAMSPGMASLVPKNYDVLSFDDDGEIKIYSRY